MTEAAPLDAELVAAEHGRALVGLAWAAIDGGLAAGASRRAPKPLDLDAFPIELRAPGATFVTLEKAGGLRGCIGSLQAHRPLVDDLAQNAYAAAFRDPRFPPLEAAERPDVCLSISILSAPEVIAGVESEADLLAALEPGVDGLILADGARRATFLPQVWKQLPAPADFVTRLKAKAGLPADHWGPGMKVWRYGVVKIGDETAQGA
ncbi:MAG: AmmeMemoRadiSam system protein A [Nitratireductor sp.]